MTPGTVICIVERADHWRLEVWKPSTPRGRMTHEGNLDPLLRIAAEMVADEDIHILPRTASTWYGPTQGWCDAP